MYGAFVMLSMPPATSTSTLPAASEKAPAAAAGESGRAAPPLLLLCYDYDASTGRYSLAIMKVLRLASAIMAIVTLLALARITLGERRRA